LRAPASEERIVALERRLGATLPPSYRAFLAVSDGALAQPAAGVMRGPEPLGFLGCELVAWLRDDDRTEIDIWAGGQFADPFRSSAAEVAYLDHDGGSVASDATKCGHLLYALRISNWDDSGLCLVNPLVVDQNGEWEVWHFSVRYLGAFRFRSFRAFLEHDIGELESAPVRQAELRGDPEALQAVALDRSRPDNERLGAAGRLVRAGGEDAALPLLLEWAAAGATIELRQGALRCLAECRDSRALDALIAVADEPNAHERLLSVVVGRLASHHDPVARAAAMRVLTRSGASDLAFSSVGRGAADVLWNVWQATADPRAVVQLAYCADRRACAPLADLITDPAIAPGVRERLAGYAGWLDDPSVVPALVEAAERGLARLDVIASALSRLGAGDEALAVAVRAVRESPFPEVATQNLGWSRHPDAPRAVLELFREHPTPALARALGWSGEPEAAGALYGATDDPALRGAAIEALEKIGGAAARDRLASLAASGETRAARALARLRDPRARAHLLTLLDDPDGALQAADGLRDLRDPTTAQTLLALVGADDSDLTITAAHALVSMQSPESDAAIERLLGSESEGARQLAASWRTEPGTDTHPPSD
jgi:HEAT repeat protein